MCNGNSLIQDSETLLCVGTKPPEKIYASFDRSTVLWQTRKGLFLGLISGMKFPIGMGLFWRDSYLITPHVREVRTTLFCFFVNMFWKIEFPYVIGYLELLATKKFLLLYPEYDETIEDRGLNLCTHAFVPLGKSENETIKIDQQLPRIHWLLSDLCWFAAPLFICEYGEYHIERLVSAYEISKRQWQLHRVSHKKFVWRFYGLVKPKFFKNQRTLVLDDGLPSLVFRVYTDTVWFLWSFSTSER